MMISLLSAMAFPNEILFTALFKYMQFYNGVI